VSLVRELTIPTKHPPLVGEVSANFCGYRVSGGKLALTSPTSGVKSVGIVLSWTQAWSLRIPTAVIWVFLAGALLFLPSSSSIVLTRLSGFRSGPTTFQKIWYRRESKLDLCIWIASEAGLYSAIGCYLDCRHELSRPHDRTVNTEISNCYTFRKAKHFVKITYLTNACKNERK
jgi:hypothetical protein